MLTQDLEQNLNFTFNVGFNAVVCPELQTDECWPNGDPKIFDLDELNIQLSKLVVSGQPLPPGVELVSTSSLLEDINNGTLDDAARYYLHHKNPHVDSGVSLFLLDNRTLILPANLYIADNDVEGNTVLDMESTQVFLSELYRNGSPLPLGVTVWWLDEAYSEINEGIFSVENILIPIVK